MEQGNGFGILGPMEEDELLSVPQVAAELGVKRWAVWNYIDRGFLKATKLQRDYAIRRSELDRFKGSEFTRLGRRGRPRSPES